MCEATVELENAFMCVEANIQTPSATNKLLHCMHPETATNLSCVFFPDVLCSVFVVFLVLKLYKQQVMCCVLCLFVFLVLRL